MLAGMALLPDGNSQAARATPVHDRPLTSIRAMRWKRSYGVGAARQTVMVEAGAMCRRSEGFEQSG